MIGELRERITLQYSTKTSSGMGASDIKTWVDYATVWAKAWSTESAEAQAAKQTSMTRIQKFKIRYRSVLKPDWRIKWGVRYFNITAIDPDEKKEFIFITCKEEA
jgi:SPP1 family predicted phage head-tail adaptor